MCLKVIIITVIYYQRKVKGLKCVQTALHGTQLELEVF